MNEDNKDRQNIADEIVNYFMQKCQAVVSKKDFDFVHNTILKYELEQHKVAVNSVKPLSKEIY